MCSSPVLSLCNPQIYTLPFHEDHNLDDLIETLLNTSDGSSQALFEKAKQGTSFSEAQLEHLGAYFEKSDANNGTRNSVAAILGEVARNGQMLPQKALQGLRLCTADEKTDELAKQSASIALCEGLHIQLIHAFKQGAVSILQLLEFQDQLIKESPLANGFLRFEEIRENTVKMTGELIASASNPDLEAPRLQEISFEYNGERYYPQATSSGNNACAIHAVIGENIRGIYCYSGDAKRHYTSALISAIDIPIENRSSSQERALEAYSDATRNYLTGEDPGAIMLFGSEKGRELKQKWEAISTTPKDGEGTPSFDDQLALNRYGEGKLWLPLIEQPSSLYLDLIMADVEVVKDPTIRWYQKNRAAVLQMLQDDPALIIDFVSQQKDPNPFMKFLETAGDLKDKIHEERITRTGILRELYQAQDDFIFSKEMIENYIATVNTYAFFLDTNDLKVLANLFNKKVVVIEDLSLEQQAWGSQGRDSEIFVDKGIAIEEINLEHGEGEPIVIQHFGAHFSRCLKIDRLTTSKIGGKRDVSLFLAAQPEQRPTYNLDLIKIVNTIFLSAQMIQGFQHVFEPTRNTPSEVAPEILESVLLGHLIPGSLMGRSREYIPTQIPAYPSVTQRTTNAILDLLIRTCMAKRPQYFDSDSSEDGQYKIFHNFLKEFVQNGAISHWLKKAREKIDSGDQDTPTQRTAFHEVVGVMELILNYIGSDRIYDDFESPLYRGVDPKELERLRELSSWLDENKEDPKYSERYQEFSLLKERVGLQQDSNIKRGGEYIFGLLKGIDPEFQEAEGIEDLITIMKKRGHHRNRKEFEEYFVEIFPQGDIFEPNQLRRFWENLYSKQHGPIFYEVVCEALDPSNRESVFHQSILQLWYLSLIDTIHASPQEGRSRMPALSFSGIPAPNFGYDMAHSKHYSKWLSNSIVRASGDIIMDGFYWVVDLGVSLDIEAFLNRLDKKISIREELFDLDIPMSEEVRAFLSHSHVYDQFLDSFAQFLLEKVYNKKFIAKGFKVLSESLRRSDVYEELLNASEERDSRNPLKSLLEEARNALKDLKNFSRNMKNLRPEEEGKKAGNLGLVFGIGFNGGLFDSPAQKRGQSSDEIWIAFAESGRKQPGGRLFLEFLKHLVRTPSQEFCSEILDLEEVSDYYIKYKNLILFKVNNWVCSSKRLFEKIKDKFHNEQVRYFEAFASHLKQDIPFECLDEEYKTWIKNFENWYSIPCELEIAEDEMSDAEKKAHESARELVFHAACQRSFASDYPQLMPLLMNHWKSQLVKMMERDKYSPELIEKVNAGALLVDVEDKRLVYPLIDFLIWDIHPVLKEVNPRLISNSKDLALFIKKKETDLNKKKKSFESQLRKSKGNQPTTKEAIQELEKYRDDLEQNLKNVTDQLETLKKPLSEWRSDVFEEFKKFFFATRALGQCVEPIFARVLGHDHFFPIYLSKSQPVCIITNTESSAHSNELRLGNRHPEYAIPPCDKNCQINALAHLYTSDLLREDQSADLLNTIRMNQSMVGIPERFFSLEELGDCSIS